MPLLSSSFTEQQYISDILTYVEHGDPQIRGTTAILCGALIQAILLKTRFNVEAWLPTVHSATGEPRPTHRHRHSFTVSLVSRLQWSEHKYLLMIHGCSDHY